MKECTQKPLRQGHIESSWKRVAGGLVLGDEDFAERLVRGRRVNMEEQRAARRLSPRVNWQQVVQAAVHELERVEEAAWRLGTGRGDVFCGEAWRLAPGESAAGGGKRVKVSSGRAGVKRFRDAVETGKDLQKTRFMKEMQRRFGEGKND